MATQIMVPNMSGAENNIDIERKNIDLEKQMVVHRIQEVVDETAIPHVRDHSCSWSNSVLTKYNNSNMEKTMNLSLFFSWQ